MSFVAIFALGLCVGVGVFCLRLVWSVSVDGWDDYRRRRHDRTLDHRLKQFDNINRRIAEHARQHKKEEEPDPSRQSVVKSPESTGRKYRV